MNSITINELHKINELTTDILPEPTKDVLQEIKQKISKTKKIEKEKQLKNGIYKWLIIYTLFYILWTSINLFVAFQNNHLMTSKINNVKITLKDYFEIISYLQIPLYLFTIFDVIYFNIPAYKRDKICDIGLIMLFIERILLTMTHGCIIGLLYVAIFISSKLSLNNHEIIGLIIIYIAQLLISIISVLYMGHFLSDNTIHNIIKKVNLYDTIPSDEEIYEEFYNQYS